MDNIIEALRQNKMPVCLMDKQLCGAMLCMDVREFDCLQSTSTIDEPDWSRMDHVSEWPIGEKYNNDYNTYRLRADYTEPEPEAGVEAKNLERIRSSLWGDPEVNPNAAITQLQEVCDLLMDATHVLFREVGK